MNSNTKAEIISFIPLADITQFIFYVNVKRN